MFIPRIAQAALVLLGALPAYNAQLIARPQSKRATVCNGYSEVRLFILNPGCFANVRCSSATGRSAT